MTTAAQPTKNTTLSGLEDLARVVRALRTGPITLAQMLVLHAVDRAAKGGETSNALTLAEALGESHPSTWRRTAELSAKGYVRAQRLPGFQGVALTVTPVGHAALEAAEAVIAAVLRGTVTDPQRRRGSGAPCPAPRRAAPAGPGPRRGRGTSAGCGRARGRLRGRPRRPGRRRSRPGRLAHRGELPTQVGDLFEEDLALGHVDVVRALGTGASRLSSAAPATSGSSSG